MQCLISRLIHENQVVSSGRTFFYTAAKPAGLGEFDTNHMGFDPVCDSGLSVCLSGLGLGKS